MNRNLPIYITRIQYYTCLPGPLTQGNTEMDQLLVRNVLEDSEFHKDMSIPKVKKDFPIMWQQATGTIRKCPICSLYN